MHWKAIMTDSLRDRIATAIMQTCHGVYMDDAVNAADAVIRELGLQREKNLLIYLPLGDERFHQPMHRYVTEWTTDE